MYQLSNPAIEAILTEWHPQDYNPPHTNIQEWIRTIESLCDTYGIPDTQRPQCATRFIRSRLRTELEDVLRDARTQFGRVHWVQFVNFMVALDRKRDPIAIAELLLTELLQKKFSLRKVSAPSFVDTILRTEHRPSPSDVAGRIIGTALCIAGAALLAPFAIGGALAAVGFTSAGVAAGNLFFLTQRTRLLSYSLGSVAATVQSVVYGGATGGLFSLLQSAGATMVLPSAGTIVAGAATTGAGIGVMGSGGSATSKIVPDSISRGLRPGNADGGGNADPPPYTQADPFEYLLTPSAIKAIVKSWNILPYNPPETNVTDWLKRLHKICEEYGVPVPQRAQCAMHHMGTDCREAAHAAGCRAMTWDPFKTWLRRYDGACVVSKVPFLETYIATTSARRRFPSLPPFVVLLADYVISIFTW